MWCNGKLSLAYLTVDGASPFEHVDAAAAGGFAAAGLRLAPPRNVSGVNLLGDRHAARSLRLACEASGVKPLDAEVLCISESTTGDDLRAMVDCAADVGFCFVQTVVEDHDSVRSADTLGRLGELAADAGMSVALEFMVFRALRTAADALHLIESSGATNVGLVIDALHLARSGGAPQTIAGIRPELIAMAQLCDAPLADAPGDLVAEARGARLHPGQGTLWLNELLDALPDGIPIGIEVPDRRESSRPFDSRATEAMRQTRAFLADRELRRAQDALIESRR